eukprot:m.141056 g.141056  ORF g.141056 m.141056 type:complete len:493 (-) comp52587_c0_seq5:71-1549(-)
MAVYNTIDDVRHLRVRVTLRRTLAATLTQYFEERIVRWQEKIFSVDERNRFANRANCESHLQLEYHARITAALRDQAPVQPHRIFTYIDQDDHHQLQDQARLTTAADELSTPLSGYLRHRKPHPPPSSADFDRLVETKARATSAHATDEQVMFIMADLSSQLDPYAGIRQEERVLCSIRVGKNGTIVVTPDFTRDRESIKFETADGDRYEYSIQHASLDLSPVHRGLLEAAQVESDRRKMEQLSNKVGTTFSAAPHVGALRAHVFGEIVSATGFEFNDLYVRLCLDVPEGWSLLEGTDRESISQICARPNKDGRFHFGFPFELNAIWEPENETKQIRFPSLLIQVASFDTWERHRVEGYGSWNCGGLTGSHDVVVETWYPIGLTPTESLRRYFTGGSPELQDVKWLTDPSSADESHVLNRYGLRTRTSGSVRLRAHVALQRPHDEDRPAIFTSAAATQQTTTSIVEAFRRTRDRLKRVSRFQQSSGFQETDA